MEWLKLYPALLDDADFSRLSDEAKMMWPMFLMIAGVTRNRLPNSTEWTRNRLQFNTIRLSKIRNVLEELISIGFLIPIVYQCGAEFTQNRREENKKRKEEKSPLPPLALKPELVLDLKPASRGGGESLFEIFWEAYPRKKSKGQAQKAFHALKPKPDSEFVAMLIAKIKLAITSEQWRKDGGQYIPYPASWLRAEGWHDVHDTPMTRKTKSDEINENILASLKGDGTFNPGKELM